MRADLSVACVLALLALLAAPADARRTHPRGLRVSRGAWEGCEMLKPSTCEAHADTCALCTVPSGKRLCFAPKVAAFLPTSESWYTPPPPPLPTPHPAPSVLLLNPA